MPVSTMHSLCSIWMLPHKTKPSVSLVEASHLSMPFCCHNFLTVDVQASGPLSLLIRQKGSLPEFERKLQDAGLSDVRVQPVAPPPTPMTVEV